MVSARLPARLVAHGRARAVLERFSMRVGQLRSFGIIYIYVGLIYMRERSFALSSVLFLPMIHKG